MNGCRVCSIFIPLTTTDDLYLQQTCIKESRVTKEKYSVILSVSASESFFRLCYQFSLWCQKSCVWKTTSTKESCVNENLNWPQQEVQLEWQEWITSQVHEWLGSFDVWLQTLSEHSLRHVRSPGSFCGGTSEKQSLFLSFNLIAVL